MSPWLAFLPPLLVYGSAWLYNRRKQRCKKEWLRMGAVAWKHNLIATGRERNG